MSQAKLVMQRRSKIDNSFRVLFCFEIYRGSFWVEAYIVKKNITSLCSILAAQSLTLWSAIIN